MSGQADFDTGVLGHILRPPSAWQRDRRRTDHGRAEVGAIRTVMTALLPHEIGATGRSLR